MNHQQLIKLGQSLGYSQIDEKGLCQGFSMMWIQAACHSDKHLEDFDARMRLLDEFRENPEQFNLEVNRVRNLSKQKIPLNERDKALIDTPAFFEGISLYLSPNAHKDVFNQQLIQQDAAKISEYTKPDKSVEGLHSKNTVDQYNKNELNAHLMNLANELKDKAGVAINFLSTGHAVCARYIGNNEFEFIDTNFDTQTNSSIAAERLNIDQLGDKLRSSFKNTVKDGTLMMSTTVFANNAEQIHNLNLTNSINKIDDLQADSQGFTLLHVALDWHNKELFNRIDLDKVDVNQLTALKVCPLSHAVGIGGSKELFERMMEAKNINVNPPDSDWQLPISLAINASQWDMAKQMIEHPTFNPAAKDAHGWSPLHSAAFQEGPEALVVAQKLLEKKADINTQLKMGGTTPLHYACIKGNAEMVKLLLTNGADHSKRSNKGETPLDIACKDPKNDVISALLPHVNITMGNFSKDSPLLKAVQTCLPETRKEFLKEGLNAYIKGLKAHPESSSLLDKARNNRVFGYSEQLKVKAAENFLKHLDDPTKPLDVKNIGALKNGRLSSLYDFYNKNKEAPINTSGPQFEEKAVLKDKQISFKAEMKNTRANQANSQHEQKEVVSALPVRPGF